MFYVVIIATGIVFSAVTCLLGIYAKKRLIKYIPASFAGIVSLAFFVKAKFFSEGLEGLGYIILMMISIAVFVLSIITAIILEFINRRK